MADKTKKHWIFNEWALVTGGAILSVLFTSLYDLIRSNPFLSTITTGVKWFFTIDIKLWWVLTLAVFVLIFKRFISIKKVDKIPLPGFYKYTEGKLKNWKWTWAWAWSASLNSWVVKDLMAYCPICGTRLLDYSNSYNHSFKCPRCDRSYNDLNGAEDKTQIEALIVDNVNRNLNRS